MWRLARDLAWKASGTVRARLPTAPLIAAVSTRRLIFSISAGRTGSKSLGEALALLPDVESLHEPKPNFVWAMQEVQTNPALATTFLLGAKLPAIARSRASVYFESSHLFGKGFYELLLALGLNPDLIMMRRDPRATALSHFRLNSVPGRTRPGMRYLIDPACPNFLPVEGWRGFTDYQLTYWYALETARRQAAYAAIAGRRGARVVWAEIAALADRKALAALLDDLALAAPARVVDSMVEQLRERRNQRETVVKAALPSTDSLAAQEAEVEKALVA